MRSRLLVGILFLDLAAVEFPKPANVSGSLHHRKCDRFISTVHGGSIRRRVQDVHNRMKHNSYCGVL